MDIQVSSNFERYLYYLLGGDAEALRGLMERLGREGSLGVSGEQLAQVQAVFDAVAVSDGETLAQIRDTYSSSGYVLDPHTAVGVWAARRYPGAVCLATAHPAKFGDAVREAIGREPEMPPALQGLMGRETRCALLEAQVPAVQSYLEQTLGVGA
jgi:threonine synthase